MTEKKKPLTIALRFRWDVCTPDPRQYQQQRQILNPDYLIEIDIPLDTKYVRNKADILAAQVSSDLNVPEPILTPAGKFLAISLLEAPYLDEIEQRVDEALDSSKVDWGDGEFRDGEAVSDWDNDVDTDEPSTQFEPEETVVKDDEDDKAPDWSDEKSWD